MSDSEEQVNEWLEDNPICDADDLNKRERELVKAAWQAALSANGGEVVGWIWSDGGGEHFTRLANRVRALEDIGIAPQAVAYATPSVPENEIKARTLEDAAIKVVAEAVEIEIRLDDGQDIVDGTALIEEHIAEWLHKQAARLRTAGDEGEE